MVRQEQSPISRVGGRTRAVVHLFINSLCTAPLKLSPFFLADARPSRGSLRGGANLAPDSRALTRVRSAIVREPEQWAVIRKKLELDGDSLAKPPRGFDSKHPSIDDTNAGEDGP